MDPLRSRTNRERAVQNPQAESIATRLRDAGDPEALSAAEARPLPSEETTPPVMKM